VASRKATIKTENQMSNYNLQKLNAISFVLGIALYFAFTITRGQTLVEEKKGTEKKGKRGQVHFQFLRADKKALILGIAASSASRA
jgi:hypothetical protein